MESKEIVLEEIWGRLFEQAESDFLNSEEGKLLQEKRNRIDRDCETMLTADEREFVQETYSVLLHMERKRREFAYQRGMRDCVRLLKQLGILA